MTLDWRPRPTTSEEDARALAVAVAAGTVVGATAFWLVRTLLGRDEIRIEPPESREELPSAGDAGPSRPDRPRLERGDG